MNTRLSGASIRRADDLPLFAGSFILVMEYSSEAHFSSPAVFVFDVVGLSSRDFPLLPEKFRARVVSIPRVVPTSRRVFQRMTSDFRNYYGNWEATSPKGGGG